MSDKRVNEIGRRQRFRRRLRGEKKAVSPVVATLILILVAVAAAAALYLWLVAWQGGVTHGIGSPGAQYTVTIGGSTSVYPFDQVAVTQFQQNNSDVVISNNQGGTGAGMVAVCTGQVDIGTSSTAQTVAGLQSSDGCPATTSIQIVAYDAVDVIVQNANPHGLVSISYDTLTAVYDGASTSAPTLVPTTYNTVAVSGIPFAEAPFNTHAALSWSQIPAAVPGATVAGCPVTTETVSTVAATGTTAQTGAACAAPNANDYYTIATTASSCGFTICAGGTVASPGIDAVVPVERSDAAGSTQTFEARLLDATSSTKFATTFSAIGFSGCGSNNLLSDCGIAVPTAVFGDPGMISYVAGNPDAIGYASDGLTRVSTSGVTCEGVSSSACGIGLESVGQSAAVQPQLGSSGSIAIGTILGGFGPTGATTTKTSASAYAGARPFEFVTTNTPTGEVQRFIEFVMDPANNQNIAGESYEVSYYSV